MLKDGTGDHLPYLRVSTDRQDVDNQRHGILEYANTHGLAPVQFVEDAASGRMAWRDRAIGQLLIETANAGDIFAEISRMAHPPAFSTDRHEALAPGNP
jgi:DNA invertase Pin-like site-specific DNA recombinase